MKIRLPAACEPQNCCGDSTSSPAAVRKETTAVACGGSLRMPCNASVPSWIVTRDSWADLIGCTG